MTILHAAAPSPAGFFGPTIASGCSLDTVDAGAEPPRRRLRPCHHFHCRRRGQMLSRRVCAASSSVSRQAVNFDLVGPGVKRFYPVLLLGSRSSLR